MIYIKELYETDYNKMTTFEKGKIYCVTNYSISGKIILLRILGRLLACDSKIFTTNKKDKNISIGYVFQGYTFNEELNIFDNVIELKNNNIDKDYIIKLLEKVKLKDKINCYPNELSDDEKKMLILVREISNNPDILLVDESVLNLDIKDEAVILEIFQQLKNEGKCIIISSYNESIKTCADIILNLNDSKLDEKVSI